MSDKICLFIGVPVAPAVASELAATCESLARRATSQGVAMRWLPPAGYHVTIKYLGWSRRDVVPAVREAMARAQAGVDPFRFRAARLGAFSSIEKANIVWAGVDDPTGALGRLAAAFDRELTGLGFAPEDRPYKPHVTLARLKSRTNVGDVLLPFSEQVFSETRVDFVTLFETVTTPRGSEYPAVLRERLGTPVSGVDRQSVAVEPTTFDASAGTEDGWDRHH